MKPTLHYTPALLLGTFVAGATLPLLGATSAVPGKAPRPNIVFILTDDQNKNTVGCYERLVSTPHIDALAANGVKFNNANVVTTVSSPSRYTLLTGRYYNSNYSPEFLQQYPPGTVSCVNNDIYLEKDGNNVAGKLQKVGYTTGFVGKLHLLHHELLGSKVAQKWKEAGLKTYPEDSDPRIDKATDEAMHFNHRWWCEELRPYGFDYVNGFYAANLRELFNTFANTHNVEWSMDAALKFLDAQKGSEKPFLLWMCTTYPHGPAPQQLVKGKFVSSLDADPVVTGEGCRWDLAGETEARKEIVAQYGKMLQENPKTPTTAAPALWWDSVVGRVVAKLREMGVEENTLIVYISDHGVVNGGKTSLYEDGNCVPMVMQWKAGLPQGVEYDHVVGSIDLAPTFMELAGVDMKKARVDGVSLLPMFKDVKKPIRDALLLEIGYARAIKTDEYKYIAVRYPEKPLTKVAEKGTNKYYYMMHGQLCERSAAQRPNYFMADQMYDYRTDPAEANNLYGQDAKRDEKYRALLTREVKRYSNRKFGEFNK